MARSIDERSERPDRSDLTARVEALDWPALSAALDEGGYATTGALLTPDECAALARAYDDEALFRSRIVMARHGYGQGEYKYFDYPLPAGVESLRQELFPRLAAVANRWNADLGVAARYPLQLRTYLRRCHAAGQKRPTPLILRYGVGDYNNLHQDLYGEHLFPLQVAILLSKPNADFTGCEFILAEQRPRRQSRAEVVPLEQGGGVIFAVRHRPVRGARGYFRATMRHGVSRLRSGHRHTLGIIFHDAR